MSVINFPADKPLDPLFGPITHNAIVVDDRLIPLLTGYREGHNTALVVDGRFTVSIPNEFAYQVAWLLAQAIAVASGYSHLGAANKECPFAPEVRQVKHD